MDPFELLLGMAASGQGNTTGTYMAPPYFMTNASTLVGAGAGDCFADIISSRIEQCDRDVSSLIAPCSDASWKSGCGDIVCVNNGLGPS